MPVPKTALVAGSQVHLRRPTASDSSAFIELAKASARLHRGWVQAPATKIQYDAYLRRFAGVAAHDNKLATHVGLLLCRNSDQALVGVFNLSEIVRSAFQSSYLGYYAFAPAAGQGYMADGLALVFKFGFRTLKLHRIEVNVQPANVRSVALVRRAGLTREGFSRRYVKVAGRWRDHERWAMLVEDWRARRTK